MILTFAALGSLLFLTDLPNKKNWSINYPAVIPVQPNISQVQAFQIAQEDLKAKLGTLEGVRIGLGYYNYSRERDGNNLDYDRYVVANHLNRGYPIADAYQHPELLNLHLHYIRPNGTGYSINPATHEVGPPCNTLMTFCPYSPVAAKEARGHLFYFVILTLPNAFKSIDETGYLIDAQDGRILWDLISYQESKDLQRK